MTQRKYFLGLFGIVAGIVIFWNVRARIDEAVLRDDELALRGCLVQAEVADHRRDANALIDCAKSLPNGFGIAGRNPIIIVGRYHGLVPDVVGGRLHFRADSHGGTFAEYELRWSGKPHGYVVENP